MCVSNTPLSFFSEHGPIPALVDWSIPYIIYQVFFWDYSSISLEFVLWQIQGCIFGQTFFSIWFMPSLAIGILLSYWFIEHTPAWATSIATISCYIVGSLTMTYSFIIDEFSMYEPFHDFIYMWLNGSRGQFLYGFPLVTLGYLVAKNKDKFRTDRSAFLTIISMALLLGEALLLRKYVGHTGIDLAIFIVPVTYFSTAFLITVPIKYFPLCKWMRKMSVLIFMSQRLFLTVLRDISPTVARLYNNQFYAFIIVVGGTFTMSLAIIFLSKRVKCLYYLY